MTCFVSFNVNGIRARQHQLEALIDSINPDIIGLQETKVEDDKFPLKDIEKLGYHAEFFGQKSHYGVALLSKIPPIFIQKGFHHDDDNAQRRLIHARYLFGQQEIDVINGYFPQGESRHHPTKFPMKRDFYQHLTNYVSELSKKNHQIILMGDMNISPQDIDIGIGGENAKRWLKMGSCSFLPEEREWYQQLIAQNLQDTYRLHYPDSQDFFSWFDYRSKGFQATPKRGLRIDHILCSKNLANLCLSAGISYELRNMEKPSDHAPIWANFNF